MLNNRQLATMLAGLRLLQRHQMLSHIPTEIIDIQTDANKFPAMTSEEIDELCDTLSVGRSNKGDLKFWSTYRKKTSADTHAPRVHKNLKIINTTLSTRLRNGLTNRHYETIGDLDKLSRAKFLMFPGLGKGTLVELERYLGRPLIDAPPPKFANYQQRIAWYENKNL